MRVYIGQFDCFWSLSYEEWLALCQKAIQEGGYDLNGYKELKYRPKGILRDREDNCYFAVSNDFIYVEPLDWYPEDFEEWLKENEHPIQDQKEGTE